MAYNRYTNFSTNYPMDRSVRPPPVRSTRERYYTHIVQPSIPETFRQPWLRPRYPDSRPRHSYPQPRNPDSRARSFGPRPRSLDSQPRNSDSHHQNSDLPSRSPDPQAVPDFRSGTTEARPQNPDSQPRYTTTGISREQSDSNRINYNNTRPRNRTFQGEENPPKSFQYYCMQSMNIQEILNFNKINSVIQNQENQVVANEPNSSFELAKTNEPIVETNLQETFQEPQNPVAPSSTPLAFNDIDSLFTIDTTPDISNLEKVELIPKSSKPPESSTSSSPTPSSQLSSSLPPSSPLPIPVPVSPSNQSTDQSNPEFPIIQEPVIDETNNSKIRNKKKKGLKRKKIKKDKKSKRIKKGSLDCIETITLSDSDSNESIVEIPLPKPPLIEISSDEETSDTRLIDVEHLDPTVEEPENQDKSSDGVSDVSSVLSENIFRPPQSKTNENPEGNNSSPESRCSDDFMQNDSMDADANTEYNFIYHNEGLECVDQDSAKAPEIVSTPNRHVEARKTNAKTYFMTDVYETESSCASDMLEQSSRSARGLSTPENQERRYEELDLDQFACMITPNRSGVETPVTNSSLFHSKTASSNVIKTKNIIGSNESDSSSEESDESSGVSQRKKAKMTMEEGHGETDQGVIEVQVEVHAEAEPEPEPEIISESTDSIIQLEDLSREKPQEVSDLVNEENENSLVNLSSDEDNVDVSSDEFEDIDIETPDMILNIKPREKNRKRTHQGILINLEDPENRFDNVWTPDRNVFYNTSWGGEHFDHVSEQFKMPFHPKAWSAPNDQYPNYQSGRKIRCLNCRQFGHIKINCDVPIKKCGMCGKRTHSEYRCPSACCLNCFNKNERKYRNSCDRCRQWRKKKCSICKITGHVQGDCPDLWRRYHLTTQPGKIVRPYTTRNNQCNQKNQLWCSGCATRGHLSETCPRQKSFEFTQNSMSIIQYKDVYKPETPSPRKRPKYDDQDTWCIHKMEYDVANRSFVSQDDLANSSNVVEKEIVEVEDQIQSGEIQIKSTESQTKSTEIQTEPTEIQTKPIEIQTKLVENQKKSNNLEKTNPGVVIQDNKVSNSTHQDKNIMALRISNDDASKLFGGNLKFLNNIEKKHKVEVYLKHMQSAYVFIRDPRNKELRKIKKEKIFRSIIQFLKPKPSKENNAEIVKVRQSVIDEFCIKENPVSVKHCLVLCRYYLFSELPFIPLFYKTLVLKVQYHFAKKDNSIILKKWYRNVNSVWIRLKHNSNEKNYKVLHQFVNDKSSQSSKLVPEHVTKAFMHYFKATFGTNQTRELFKNLAVEIKKGTDQPLTADQVKSYGDTIFQIIMKNRNDIYEVGFVLNLIQQKMAQTSSCSSDDVSLLNNLKTMYQLE